MLTLLTHVILFLAGITAAIAGTFLGVMILVALAASLKR